jgi:ABC-2 type transport system ATP-binding protein
MPYALSLAKQLQLKLNTQLGDYSRGNRQKVGLVAAMMHKPELLILDEPTTGFDPIIQDVFAGLLRQYRDDGGTVFMSSHILSEVQQLCDRVAFIREGKLVGTKSLKELSGSSARLIRVAGPDATRLKLAGLKPNPTQPGVYTYSGDIKRFVSYVAAKEISDLTITEPELEDAFMHYYKKSGSKS